MKAIHNQENILFQISFVVLYPKYPTLTFVQKKYEKRILIGITSLIIIMIVPSFYLAYNLFQEKKFTKTVENFVNTEFINKAFQANILSGH